MLPGSVIAKLARCTLRVESLGTMISKRECVNYPYSTPFRTNVQYSVNKTWGFKVSKEEND
jgi:hypothetical protein